MINEKDSYSGISIALSAFLIWGLFPLYFKQLTMYEPFEIIAHRIIWCCVFCGVLLVIKNQLVSIRKILVQPKQLMLIFLSSVIITVNWTTYVWAVNNNQIVEASLGYFINPLLGVLLAVVMFNEKLRKLQVLAISFACTSVLLQVLILGELPIISLLIAISFTLYGAIHKNMAVSALPALFLESLIITPFVIFWLFTQNVASSSISFWTSENIWLLMLAGPITLIPLILYNTSTKLVPFTTLSFLNYSSPTIIFLLAVFYYNEPFSTTKLALFSLIWIGLAFFSIDILRNTKKSNTAVDK